MVITLTVSWYPLGNNIDSFRGIHLVITMTVSGVSIDNNIDSVRGIHLVIILTVSGYPFGNNIDSVRGIHLVILLTVSGYPFGNNIDSFRGIHLVITGKVITTKNHQLTSKITRTHAVADVNTLSHLARHMFFSVSWVSRYAKKQTVLSPFLWFVCRWPCCRSVRKLVYLSIHIDEC